MYVHICVELNKYQVIILILYVGMIRTFINEYQKFITYH